MHQIIPIRTSIIKESKQYEVQDYISFFIENTGNSTLYVDGVCKMEPDEKIEFQPVYNSVYNSVIDIRFSNEEPEQKNEATIVYSVYKNETPCL